MSLHYVYDQLRRAKDYLDTHGRSSASDAVDRALDAFPRVVELVLTLAKSNRSLEAKLAIAKDPRYHELLSGNNIFPEVELVRPIEVKEYPTESDIQAALNFGHTAEQHLKGGDPRG